MSGFYNISVEKQAGLPGQSTRLVIESALFAVCASSEGKKEGTAAFMGKRQAQFTGR
jgi:enoyl-CoA hydratase